MFHIKICGITSVADAQLVADAGADAIGLNFYPLSPRYLAHDVAEQIVAAMPAGVAKIGVFVNSTAAEIHTLARRLKLDAIQLHGDEPPEYIGELDEWPTIRAIRSASGCEPIAEYLRACQTIGPLPRMTLVDALHKDAYGGTGKTANWDALSTGRESLLGVPLILAGGLKLENVAEAIRIVRPAAVDTASGVELSPGRKSEPLVREFVAAAKAAFAALNG